METEWRRHVRLLFRQLFWPAVAGSVLWATVTFVFAATHWCECVWARFLSLLMLAGYLITGWWQLENLKVEPKSALYWWFDALHVVSISALAIGLERDSARTGTILTVALVITALGHLWNVWERRYPWRRVLVNASGLPVVWLAPSPWNMPAALALVLVLWTAVLQAEAEAA